MTPSNTPITPEIENIADSQGNKHTVVPTQHSHSMDEVTGLASALAGKADTTHTHKLIQYSTTSTDGFAGFTVTGTGSFTIGVQTDKSIDFQFGPTVKASITNSNVDNLARALRNPDTTPTANSDNLVTSGGVKAALDGKQDTLTFDTAPTANSTNPVTSGGVKAALDGKANTEHTHIASQVEGVMPYYLTYEGDSINLDAILAEPHTMQRLIIENAAGSSLEISAGLFTSPTEQLVIHINNTPEQFVVDPGDYALVTIFKVDRGETAHGHDVCYFAYVEGIFNYES